VKVYASAQEAKAEHDRAKRSGANVIVWNPEEQAWESPKTLQLAQGCVGCGGCSPKSNHAARR
jgi:hypothetical protein